MMRSTAEIRQLLDELDQRNADSLEAQDLDFKRLDTGSLRASIALVVEYAVCMANGGGGTVVFGVEDKAVGRTRAILGIPPEIDLNLVLKAVYDSTDPKITPQLDELHVPEGTGRLLVMHVPRGLPPYTTTSGEAKIRIGTECKPLTGTLRRQIHVETGETDVTRQRVPGSAATMLSAAALEVLRAVARRENVPEDLARLSDWDLLQSLGAIEDGQLTVGGLLVAGSAEAIAKALPNHLVTYLRMSGETAYTGRLDSREAIPVVAERLLDNIMADNPLETFRQGLFHFEYRTFPEIALREAGMNALCHRDFLQNGPVVVKQSHSQIEISSPGGLVGGVSTTNILCHPPTARNPHLVDLLVRLRLVNRTNLGVRRMFEAMLVEGKEPPLIEAEPSLVRVTFPAHAFSPSFRSWVEIEAAAGRLLTVEQLLVIRYLLRHPEVDIDTAVRLCQRAELPARELLSEMERRGYLERGGTGRGLYYRLTSALANRLGDDSSMRLLRIDWEAAKTRVLSVLHQREKRGEAGLTNTEIRAITYLDREQVKRLMRELAGETLVQVNGRGRNAVWRAVRER